MTPFENISAHLGDKANDALKGNMVQPLGLHAKAVEEEMKKFFSDVYLQADALNSDLEEAYNQVQESMRSPKPPTQEVQIAFDNLTKAAKSGDLRAIKILGELANQEKTDFSWHNTVMRASDETLLGIFKDFNNQSSGTRNAAHKARKPHTEKQKVHIEKLENRIN